MGDSQNLDQLKNQYRIRFYRDRAEDLPELPPGTNVLSAIKDYFNDSGGEESPGFSRSSFSADSVTNVNVLESIQKKQGSSITRRTSKSNGLHFIEKRNENKLKAAKSPAVNKTPTHCVVSEEEMDDFVSDMPLNLVVEREEETKIIRTVSNASRDRIYSSDCSVVQGPPSPASKSSPQKRLLFREAEIYNKESFASVFANKYKRGPADDIQIFPMHESVSYTGNKYDPRPITTAAEFVTQEDDDEFVIEDEQSINMSFSSENRRSSVGSSKKKRATASSSTRGKRKLQHRVSEVFSEPSPFCLGKGQPTWKENSPNVNRMGTTDESNNILSAERLKETKMTPSSAMDESKKLSIKSKAISEQSLTYSQTVEKTKQINKALEFTEEDPIFYTNRKKIKIPRTTKSKAKRLKSLNVSHQMVEIESVEKVSEQSIVQSKKDDDEAFVIEDEQSINMSFSSVNRRLSVGSPKKKRATASSTTDEIKKLPNKSKAISEQSLAYSKTVEKTKQINKELELTEEDPICYTNRKKVKTPRTTKSKAKRSKSPSVSHQTMEIESAVKVSEQSIVQSKKKNTLRDEEANKGKDAPCKDKNSFTSHLVKIGISKSPIKRVDINNYSELPVVVEDEEFVIQDITDSGTDFQSWNKKTHKIPNDSKKNKKSKNKVPPGALNVTYTSARKSDGIVTESRESHNDSADSSSPYQDKKEKRSRRTEVDKLALQKYFQTYVDHIDQNENTSSRHKRVSAPPSTWWVVKQAGMTSTWRPEMEETIPQHSPKSKRKASAEAQKEPSEWQNNKEEIFELKKKRHLDQHGKSLKENNEKSSKILNTRKRTQKIKHIEKEEMARPSKVKKRNNKVCKKSQTSTKQSLQPTKQLEHETEESDAASSLECDLNVHDLPNECDNLSTAAISISPPVSDPQYSSPQRYSPILEEFSQKSSVSEISIQLTPLQNHKRTAKEVEEKEEEPQPRHRLPEQSHTSPAYNSAKLTFQSGPVLKTRAVRHNNAIDPVVQNLATTESLNSVDQSSMAIVLDPETESDALVECIHHADSRHANRPMWRCFNNQIFSAGKLMLGSMEMEMRDTPQWDILIFYIVRGNIMLKLHKSYHNLKSGDFFFIPPGNTYHMQNQEREEAELVFTRLKPGSQ